MESYIGTRSKILIILLILFAILGLFDSIYLSFSGPKFDLLEQLCSDSICDEFSLKIFGIHIAIYGILYYLSLLMLSTMLFKRFILIKYLVAISAMGLLFSLYFLYYQAFVIKGFCIFCLISLTATLTFFIISLYLLLFNKDKLHR